MGEVRFEIAECPPADVERLRRELGVSGAVAQVLVRRGMAAPPRARAFLAADEEHPHAAFAGIEAAIETIEAHLRAQTRITVHGDYDVDGICSTAVLVRALRGLGAEVDWYLPDRASDGYGLGAQTVRRLAARGTRLLVTADCGITAVEEVALARELGMDVLVTDHHSPRADGALPDAPIVHPGVCGYPFGELCATAVVYKLAQALLQARGRDQQELERDLDLVALATIADVVPLLGENRTLVRGGLRALAGTVKPGLRALMAVARVDPGKLDERSVAFGLAPRLNAAGRMYRADAGLELILTEDRARAARIAQELDRVNHERRSAEQRISFEAEAQIATLGDGSERRALVLAGEGWHVGVIGIVASRLAERHNRPVVLIALEGERGRGSGRAGCEAFDLLAGLTACAEHLSRYGGHRAAAGLEIERGRVAEFAAALDAHARRVLAESDMAPVERVDAVLDGGELGMALAEELRRLGPFGQGNPSVSLMVSGATFADARPMGEGKHVRFTVRSPEGRARAVAFNTGGRLPVAEDEPAQATFALEVNEWNGVSEPRLVLRHARAAAGPTVEDRRPARPSAQRGARETETGQKELVLFT
ncbi:MAG TPA: single-stranded-DNA-specific exonuclease RecJ [Solirubrobacteraceae bacterium]|nr:single-stranded-DNA-specific exonuclease RecJ [Solirubrobacteraceae bacterium]